MFLNAMTAQPQLFRPDDHADARPDAPAVIQARTGEVVSYRQTVDRSRQLAQLLHARGLRPGDQVAILMDNRAECCRRSTSWATSAGDRCCSS